MNAEITMKKFLERNIEELKEQGLFALTVILSVLGILSVVLFLATSNGYFIFLALINFGAAVFNCIHAATKGVIKSQEELIADYRDAIILIKADFDKLQQKLDAYNSAQSKEAEKTKKVSPIGEVGGVSKRKPAPKRKPKTEKKNENNMD